MASFTFQHGEILGAILFALNSLAVSSLSTCIYTLDHKRLARLTENGKLVEKRRAGRIFLLRKRGTWVMLSLIMAYVASNAALTAFIVDLTSVPIGFAISTGVVFLVSEVGPRILCQKIGLLELGYWLSWLAYVYMTVFFFLWPLKRLLRLILGREFGLRYQQKSQMMDVDDPSTSIAFDFARKTVQQIMTPESKMFMLEIDQELDLKLMNEILQKGFSKVPVYEGVKSDIKGLLLTQDLALLHPEDKTPIRDVLSYYSRDIPKVDADTRLDSLLAEFKRGRDQIAIVQRVNDFDQNRDPFYETIGMVTLSDVIQTIVSADDEDSAADIVPASLTSSSVAVVFEPPRFHKATSKKTASHGVRDHLTESQLDEICAFLARHVRPLKHKRLSADTLRRLVSQAALIEVTPDPRFGHTVLYQPNRPAIFFSYIIEGHVETFDDDGSHELQAGQFLCPEALTDPDFRSTFSARVNQSAKLIRISHRLYDAAIKAQLLHSHVARGRLGEDAEADKRERRRKNRDRSTDLPGADDDTESGSDSEESSASSSTDNGLFSAMALPRLRALATPGFSNPAPGIEVKHLPKLDAFVSGIRVFDYSKDRVEAYEMGNVQAFLAAKREPWVNVRWINIPNMFEARPVITQLAKAYHFHPLAVEDALNVPQRSKVDDYDSHVYMVTTMMYSTVHDREDKIEQEQISVFLMQGLVITIQQGSVADKPDIWKGIKTRLESDPLSRIRKNDASFLCYSLLDGLVDFCFPVMEKYYARMEDLEQIVIRSPNESLVNSIHKLTQELMLVRKFFLPIRDVVDSFEKLENKNLVSKTTRVYLRDVRDNTLHILETLDTYKEVSMVAKDFAFNLISLKLNEVMKTLTVMSAIFIPMTFVSGIYGMNFEYMPELHWEFGYPMFFVVCAFIATTLIVFFKRRQWF
eukprot:TRINITY_DN3857_c0_g1_i1.p1 TRINITY_DN3857_c0_g1~~TRINITY_DN3857_c0_g1_i1.p1  ORF type:complete len:922 (+),score=329.19 TRINITY_DN3857_c0_g1_i1:123-2888(+)